MDQKMDETFFDGHEELYHHAKFGADRTMRTGCRCENVFFWFVCLSRSKSRAPCIQGVHSSNKHCVAVYCPISTLFSAFLGRLPKVDLIILEGEKMSVRTSVRTTVRPSTKSFFDFNEIWCIGRGR